MGASSLNDLSPYALRRPPRPGPVGIPRDDRREDEEMDTDEDMDICTLCEHKYAEHCECMACPGDTHDEMCGF